jgi:hypothetical protein
VSLTTLDPAGIDLTTHWANVPGATGVEVSSAPLQLAPHEREVVSTGVGFVAVDGGYRIDSDSTPIRTVGLAGLASDGRRIDGDSALGSAGLRLVVAVPARDGWVNAYAAPAGDLPAGVTGVSLAAGALHLPDVALASFLVFVSQVASGAIGANADITLTSVSLTRLLRPADLSATVDGRTVWAAQGRLTSATRTDLAAPSRIAMAKTVTDPSAQLRVPLRVSAGTAGDVDLTWSGASGAVVRTEASPATVDLAGDPVALPLPTPTATEQPGSVTADVTITYLGLRMHPVVNDSLPAGVTSGVEVETQPVIRWLPPQALIGERPARVGIIGRAASDASLTIALVDPAGRPIAPAAVVHVPAGAEFATRWGRLPQPPLVAGAVGVSVRADSGAFLWAESDAPLVRVAVEDPDPGGRPVLLDGVALPLAAPRMDGRPSSATVLNASLSPPAFAGRLPVLASELFVTARFDKLTLRYPR